MYVFAAGALFTIKIDFWLMYAFSEKLKIICTVVFDELHTLAGFLTVSVRQVGAVYTDRTYFYSSEVYR